MLHRIRNARLRTKLVASYVALGVFMTLISLSGHLYTQDRADADFVSRVEIRRLIHELMSLRAAASEGTFAYVLSGEPRRKALARAKLDQLTAKAAALDTRPSLNHAQRALLGAVVVAIRAVRADAETMFHSYEADGRVARDRYAAFERSVDALESSTAELDADLRTQFAHDHDEAWRSSTELRTIAISVATLVVAIALARAMGRRITRPLLSLRRAVLGFGAGEVDATVADKSCDELGELACAFEKMAADTRRHLEQRLEDIFGSIRELLVVTRDDGTIISANPACCQLSGYGEQELIGKPASMLFAGGVPGLLGGASARGSSSSLDSVFWAANGRQLSIQLSASRLRGQGSDGWVLVARDLTEQHRLEAELRQAQKMEAIGRLAGGVAHDFNNMLAVIIGYSTLLLDELPEDHPMRGDLMQVKQAADRSAELTQQLLAFSRSESLETTLIDLNDAVESTSRMVRRVLGEDIVLSTVLSTNDCNVRVAAGQIEQIIMNLVVNARDAMPAGGRLTIETSRVELGQHGLGARASMPAGTYARLAVSDDGSGMDKATLERIFEPFFTTKEQGKGTGLGLSTVFAIVRQCGGHICATSEPGKGARFDLYFEDRGAAHATHTEPAAPTSSLAQRTVLVVEDEEQVRSVVCRVLQHQGHRVLSAKDPYDGLRLCEQHPGAAIHLLLTDVIMPQMSGRELADWILLARPAIKLLFMSGYTSDVVLNRIGEGEVAFLQKPMTPRDLSQKVEQLLTIAPRQAEGPALHAAA